MMSSIADLKPDPRNARRHGERNIRAIARSLEELGAGRSILIDANNQVIAGNGVLEAAATVGIEKVTIVEATGHEIIAVRRSDLTGKQRLRMALADNRTAELAEWDADILADIAAKERDALEGLWSEAEIAEMLPVDAREDPGAQIDRAEELRGKWGVELGQLWELGEHRLICGDCTDRAVVEKVMAGERARLIWTDPPYGVNYGAKLASANPIAHRVRTIENDNLSPDKLEGFIRSALKCAAGFSAPGAAIYVACPPGTLLPTLISAFVGSGFDFRWGLVWVKDQLVLGRGDYHFKHENILYGWKPDGAHYFIDDRTQTSVFEYPRPKRSEEHPTMKPVELVEHMISNSSRANEIVLDPFLGSGTTLIACERLGRKCRAVEISPSYCAVTIQRWADMTGGEPRRIDG